MNPWLKSLVRFLCGVIIGAAIGLLCQRLAHANCGNDNGNGNGCSGQQGPAGPKGDTGAQGPVGAAGAIGPAGQSYDVSMSDRTDLILGAELRAYDSQYIQLKPFIDVVAQSTAGGNVVSLGMRVQFKLGKSYEEKRLEQFERELRALEAE